MRSTGEYPAAIFVVKGLNQDNLFVYMMKYEANSIAYGLRTGVRTVYVKFHNSSADGHAAARNDSIGIKVSIRDCRSLLLQHMSRCGVADGLTF